MDILSKKEKDAIRDLKKILLSKYNLIELKVFGSKVKGYSDVESDIDIFIVLEKYDWEIEKDVYRLCFEIGLKYDILLSPIIYSKAEIEDKLTKITPFYKAIEREGIPV